VAEISAGVVKALRERTGAGMMDCKKALSDAGGDPERTVVSATLCNASTVIGFGLLGLAATPVLNAIGATVATGALLSLMFAAVLAGASGRRPR